MVRTNGLLSVLAIAFVALVMGTSAQLALGATISWSGAMNITANSDISTVGGYFDAIKFGTTASSVTDTNGDLFNGVTLASGLASQNGLATDPITVTISTNSNYPAGAPSPSTGDANYDAIVSTLGYDAGTVTLNSLTNGNHYLVEIWVNQTVNRNHNTAAISGGPTLLDSTVPGVTAGGAGQYAIGNFVATGTSQTFALSSLGPDSIVNAIMVRTVPEPSSFILCGLGAVGLFAVARRRRKASI